MSWQIAADIREMFVELVATDGKESVYGRNVSRKDQLTSGLAEALHLLPSGFKAQEASLYLRTDFDRISLREKWGGHTALLTTEGFENLLEIDNQSRRNTFGLHPKKAAPLIARDSAFGVTERIKADGSIEVGIDEKEIEFVMSKLALAEVKSVAICLLHSKINPQHENQLAEKLRSNGYYVVCSHKFEGNELERAKKASAEAFVWTGRQGMLEDVAKLGFLPERIFLKPEGSDFFLRKSSGLEKLEAALGAKVSSAKDKNNDILNVQFIEDRITIEFHSGSRKIIAEILSSPLCKVLIDEGHLVHIGPDRIESEPGPVCFGKGITLSALDLIAFVGKLKNTHAMPRFKVDISRVSKQLVPLAKQLQLDIDTCAQKFLNLYFERVAGEIILKVGSENLSSAHLISGGWLAPIMTSPIARRLHVKKFTIQPHSGWIRSLNLLEAKMGKTSSPPWGTLEFENGATAEGESFEL